MTSRLTGFAGVLTSAALVAAFSVETSQTAASESPPNFSSAEYGFAARGEGWKALRGSPPPVDQDPRVRYVPNNTPGEQPTYRYADANNPNLTQWAKDRLKKDNELQDKGFHMFSRQARCWPAGAAAFRFSPGTPTYFIQTPKVVWMIYAGDQQVRRVFLNVPHSANPKPSWYGESVGHYEGDTLVVDTIAETTKTFIDQFRTPHGPKLHVIERIRLVERGDVLETELTIEDPDALLKPLRLVHQQRKVEDPMTESSCNESGGDPFALDAEPIPEDSTPDF
jgi:hypothetical protein